MGGQPITIVKELLAAHPTDDTIFDNTNPCDVSLEGIYDTETAATIDFIQEPIITTTTSMSTKNDKPWFNAHKESDWWYNFPETMDSYQEWEDPLNILRDTSIISESPKGHIKPDFYIAKRQI